MELEQKITLIKSVPQKDSTPEVPSAPINIPPKKKLINENSPIIKRIQRAEKKASREKLSDDELIEREFKDEAEAIRAKTINEANDIKDYIWHSQIPQTRNLADIELESEADFVASENDILDDIITRTPLPPKEHLDTHLNSRNMEKAIKTSHFDDRVDLSNLMPNPPRNTPQKKGSLGLIQDLGESKGDLHNSDLPKSHTDSIESKRDSRLDSMKDFLSNSGDNATPHIIDNIARAENSDAIVGIYTPDPQYLDGEYHHSVEFVDKIDNYDIKIQENNVVYGDLDSEKNIDSTDDINALNAMRDNLKQREKEIDERIKAIKRRQQLSDIKSITPIDLPQSRAENTQTPQDSQNAEDANEKIFLDFSQYSKPMQDLQTPQKSNAQKVDLSDLITDKPTPPNASSASKPNHNNITLVTRNEILERQNAESPTNKSNNDEFNENFFDLEPNNLTPPPQSTANPSTQNTTIYTNQNTANPSVNPNVNLGAFPSNDGTFHLPPLNLLNPPLSQKIDIDDSEIDIKVQNLFNKLRVFKIEGDIVRTYSGPVVTTFEFRPAANVKVSRIQNLQDDLSMALKATSIRIQAPIPGKDVVGIEIPNNKIQTIYLREIFESEEFRNSNANLPIALGKDVIGNPVIEDLATLPHLLIAGTTGSGKSVGINAMILSLLYKHTPKDLRFIMIDPKFLEFGLYKDIPHLLTPIITDPKKAIIALSKAVEEMNRRYELMDRAKVKTIVGYNELMSANNKIDGENKAEKLPYIVIIIDEFADLMIMGGREAEQFLISLAGKARASGIHLIIATQRPTVNVVTGLIKGNLPSKISYRVGSKIDSKVILDETGAEALLGRGDMLFSKTNNIVRLHAPYNDEREIERVVEFLKSQQEVEYDEFFELKEPTAMPQPTQISSEGDYIERAKEIILQSGKTSISYLQRGLGVGFNKAANIVESLEKEGFLSPPNSKGIREIIGN